MPWEIIARAIATSLTGPFARYMVTIALAFGLIMLMFGEPGAKRNIGGVIFAGSTLLMIGLVLNWMAGGI